MSIFDRFFGPPNIAKLKQRGDTAGLLKVLTYTGGTPENAKQMRRQAQEALISLGETALGPAVDFYLYNYRKTEARAIIYILREIGRRAAEPDLRLRVTERLADLMDMRSEHRGLLMQAMFTLICQPNPPAYYAAAHKIINHWTQESGTRLVQAEALLALFVTNLQMRDYQSVERQFDQLNAWTRDDPAVAQRTANALREAAAHLSDEYLMEKTVNLLSQILLTWTERKPIREAATAALAAYPITALSWLLNRMEANPKDSYPRDTLIALGQQVKDRPNEALVIERLRVMLDHPDWDVRQAVALVLRSIPWSPREAVAKAELLAAARDFRFSSWSELNITRDVIERLTLLADDPRYPAQIDLIRHLALLPPHITDREARFRLRGVLARALLLQPPQLKTYIVKGLSELEWQPSSDACAAVYWVYQFEWEKAAAVGAAGVDALIDCLAVPDPELIRTANRALTAIYESGSIDPQTAWRIQTVLEQRSRGSGTFNSDSRGQNSDPSADPADSGLERPDSQA